MKLQTQTCFAASVQKSGSISKGSVVVIVEEKKPSVSNKLSVGIIIGLAVGGVVLAGLVSFFIYKRRQKSKTGYKRLETWF
jgi:formate/nitrite transporter FocA (FNT family)